jgi:photosystem II stability/assembly factor-like uncharacterized protein
MDLGDASRLFVGKGGERWLVDVREGAAMAAPMLADEDLVAVSRPKQDVFAFIGSKGTIYTSESPLGSFKSAQRMEPAPLRVAAAGTFIVAVHWDGSLTRSTDGGKTFAPLSLPGANPLYDVAIADDGRAMVLGFPEQLWISKDLSAKDPRFALARTPTVGVGFVGVDAVGFLVARGARESITWRKGDQSELVLEDRAFESAPMDLWTDLEAGPSASALASGRATLSGQRYYEVARREEQGPWFLGRGEITDRLRWTAIPESEDCRHMAMAVHGERLAFGCMAGARKGGVLFPPLRVIYSRDGGGSFTKQSTGLVADEESVFLTVLDDDTLLVSGACKPNSRGICAPAEPMRLTPVRESRRLQYGAAEPVKVPMIVGRVNRVVAWGPRLYATGLLAGGHRPAVLVSDDRGETFRAVPLDLAKTVVAEQHDVDKILGRMQPGKLAAGEDGRLSWLLFTEAGPVWVVIDERGWVASAHLAPAEYSLLEVAGARGLAFADDGRVVESSDGGATFRPLTRMPAWMWQGEEGPVAVCGAGGCVLGEAFSRLGWGVAGGGVFSQELDVASSDPEATEAAVPDKTPSRTPIVCEIIDPVPGMIPNVVSLPDAGDAMRGTVAWSALVVDRTNASVSVAHATATPKHGVRVIPLLSPVPDATRFALEARTQVEGAAALRYVMDTDSEGNPGRPMGRVEVAWDNQFEGPPQRAVIPQGGVLRAGDATILSGHAARAQVEMLSVAPGGIHVCLHAECNQPGDRVLFLRGRGPVDAIPITPWPTVGLGGVALPLSRHITHADGKHVPIATHQHRSMVMRAHRQDDGSHAFSALALAPADIKGLGMAETAHWSYHTQGTMGLSHTLWHPTQGLARAWVLSFDASQGVGTTVPAPTQRDLSDPPSPCTSAQRKASYRIVSPALTGTQHPVIIESGQSKALMHTRVAVLHGDPGSACAEVLDARSENASRHALIPVGAMERSWLLGLEDSTLRWWPMRCRFQPGATVDDSNANLFPPATITKEVARLVTESDCLELFQKIAPVMGGLPQSALDPARRAFVEMCKEKSVDMACVRQTSDPQQILQKCMQ